MYIPANSTEISKLPASPKRYGIIGKPGTGKTWAALTFPNPIVVDLDNNLSGYREAFQTHNFITVPLWNRDLVEKIMKVPNNTKSRTIDPNIPHNVRDAFTRWLESEGPKLEEDQTLIVDSMTSLNDAFDRQTNMPFEKEYSRKTGEEDTYAFWGKKLQFNTATFATLSQLRCTVICIFHEQTEYDSNGIGIGIKPMIQGQSGEKAPKDFSDFYRQIVITRDMKNPPIPFAEGERYIYAWQTCKDTKFQIAKKSRASIPDFVRANYKELQNGNLP